MLFFLAVKCPTIPPLIGGERNTTDVIYNTYAQYKCDAGTRMLDGATYRVIRCDATGTWSDNITDCARKYRYFVKTRILCQMYCWIRFRSQIYVKDGVLPNRDLFFL